MSENAKTECWKRGITYLRGELPSLKRWQREVEKQD
jgi:hypothetical protein